MLAPFCGSFSWDISLRLTWVMAAAASDLYSILGVRKDAKAREITLAYRQLARQLHPDRHSQVCCFFCLPHLLTMRTPQAAFVQASKEVQKQCSEMMAIVSHAHSVLGDGEQRQAYDEARRSASAKAGTHEQGGAADTVDLDDMQWEGNQGYYYHNCRCGGRHVLQPGDMDESGHVIVPCDGCSLLIAVEFDIDSDASQHSGGSQEDT